MIEYPVRINIDAYRGSNRRKIFDSSIMIVNAKTIENYLNNRMESCDPGEAKTFNYGTIASDAELNIEIIHKILYKLDCGAGGITIYKPVI
ncbi:MAG: hypothetical protein WC708_14730 [Lentisphaeria bacterium]